jgi:hypothetical protein
MVLGLPWLDNDQASLHVFPTRVSTLMNGTAVDITMEKRLLECVFMSPTKVHELMRKTRQNIL